jgi:hypothetical protein
MSPLPLILFRTIPDEKPMGVSPHLKGWQPYFLRRTRAVKLKKEESFERKYALKGKEFILLLGVT